MILFDKQRRKDYRRGYRYGSTGTEPKRLEGLTEDFWRGYRVGRIVRNNERRYP